MSDTSDGHANTASTNDLDELRQSEAIEFLSTILDDLVQVVADRVGDEDTAQIILTELVNQIDLEQIQVSSENVSDAKHVMEELVNSALDDILTDNGNVNMADLEDVDHSFASEDEDEVDLEDVYDLPSEHDVMSDPEEEMNVHEMMTVMQESARTAADDSEKEIATLEMQQAVGPVLVEEDIEFHTEEVQDPNVSAPAPENLPIDDEQSQEEMFIVQSTMFELLEAVEVTVLASSTGTSAEASATDTMDVPVVTAEKEGIPTLLRRQSTRLESIASSDHAPLYCSVHDQKQMIKQAQQLAKLDRLGGGNKSVFDVKMRDIGALGIGLQLYFMLTKYLSITFLIMGIISLPAITVNYYGHGVTQEMADPLRLAYASLGNLGVNEEIASDPSNCLPIGDIDCNGTTTYTPFTSDPEKAAWIITTSDCLYSFVFLCFVFTYSYQARRAINRHKAENLTPGRYAIYIRGLPRDATQEEIVEHFNKLYDPTEEEMYFPLWFNMFWGKRRKVVYSLSKNAINRSVVSNVEHLYGSGENDTSKNKKLYLNKWVAEVSIGHPTGGLLRTFLSMEALTGSISEAKSLITMLNYARSETPDKFTAQDEKLFAKTQKTLLTLQRTLDKKKSKIKAFNVKSKKESPRKKAERKRNQTAKDKMAEAAQKAKEAATATNEAFDWEACECAFVVFNNLESRRRCLYDYRMSDKWLPRFFQPKLLRFRDGKYPLTVMPAPEPSNILWENLEVTSRGRFYRRSMTNIVTFFLLLITCIVISAADYTQDQFRAKLPPSGLCEVHLPQVFFGRKAFDPYSEVQYAVLEWDSEATCPSVDDKKLYHIAYDKEMASSLNVTLPIDEANPPVRCTDPCIDELSERRCSTLGCFDEKAVEEGLPCQTYLESHLLYCFCTDALSKSFETYGFTQGPQRLWEDYEPCRNFITDYLVKNIFIVTSAGLVVLVNLFLNIILRNFVAFERHSSETSKASATAFKLFTAQFMNTAILTLIINAALGVNTIPLIEDLFTGKFKDFERDWYPTVGMSITTTMIVNAFLPQFVLLLRIFVISPLLRCLQRRSVRTQEKMNALYAGTRFDISLRYPMVLNSVFVTMTFCGGSPVLLFVASLTCGAAFWIDKLSLIHLYSIKTAYDEAVGEIALSLLPWTLVIHLAFSMWMYGNDTLVKSSTLDLTWILQKLGVDSPMGEKTTAELYAEFLQEVEKVDILGQYGFVAKVVKTNVFLMFLLLVSCVVLILLSTVYKQFVYPVIGRIFKQLKKLFSSCFRRISPKRHLDAVVISQEMAIEKKKEEEEKLERKRWSPRKKKAKKYKPVVLPEFTDVFRKSVSRKLRPDAQLGYKRNDKDELVRVWLQDVSYNGLRRKQGQLMRTWEAMQAPVKSYAIGANEKYRLAAAEIVTASIALRSGTSRSQVVRPVLEAIDTFEREIYDDAATRPLERKSSGVLEGKITTS